MGNKRALIVGINYPGTSSELKGCVNDANNMEQLLRTQFGFKEIIKLLDNDATTASILSELQWLVKGATPGDTLVFHYSGHGSQVYDRSGDEGDRFDEIICPIDLDWRDKVITDDQMKVIFDTVPAGVNLTVILDCCHSGSGLDQANAFQPLGVGEARSFTDGGRYLAPPQEILDQISAAQMLPKPRSVQSRSVNSTAMLITGCQAHQTSADAYIDGSFQGAATYSLITSLKKASHKMSYRNLVIAMNDFMARFGYTQRPELNGPESLYDGDFLGATEQPAPSIPATPAPVQEQNKDDGKWKIVVAILIAIAIAVVALQ